ncbi:MAG: hypothetical protein ACLU4J_16000 [Butyricimonas paravirosa]
MNRAGHGVISQGISMTMTVMGGEDLVLATEVWENTGCELTRICLKKLIKDERLVKPRKTLDALVKKMRKYTDNIPENSYTEPDSRIRRIYTKSGWLRITSTTV